MELRQVAKESLTRRGSSQVRLHACGLVLSLLTCSFTTHRQWRSRCAVRIRMARPVGLYCSAYRLRLVFFGNHGNCSALLIYSAAMLLCCYGGTSLAFCSWLLLLLFSHQPTRMRRPWHPMLTAPTWVGPQGSSTHVANNSDVCTADVLNRTKIIQQIRMVQCRLNLGQYTEVSRSSTAHCLCSIPSCLQLPRAPVDGRPLGCRIAFNVYRPSGTFKKTSLGTPDFAVVVCRQGRVALLASSMAHMHAWAATKTLCHGWRSSRP